MIDRLEFVQVGREPEIIEIDVLWPSLRHWWRVLSPVTVYFLLLFSQGSISVSQSQSLGNTGTP